jgi:hypothetical protein
MQWPSWGDWAAFGTIAVGWWNAKKITEVHLSLNSRLDQWKAETDSRLAGARAQGQQDERDRRKEPIP